MDTLVTATAVSDEHRRPVIAALERALSWFALVERACSRFEPDSEVRRMVARAGSPVRVSPILYAAVDVALAVAEASDGAFDPTVGGAMQERGYDRSYLTGARARAPVTPGANWREVTLDPRRCAITLSRPLLLDLGAVAKGLAVDLALGELIPFPGAVVEAGGDLRAHGTDERSEPWRIGIRDPRSPGGLVLGISDGAICTSGGYARPALGGGHHLLDPHTGRSPTETLSATVIAPTCAAADPLATAAFLLGAPDGLELLERQGAQGMIVTQARRWHTRGIPEIRHAA